MAIPKLAEISCSSLPTRAELVGIGEGLRLFEHFDTKDITLKKISVTEPTTTRIGLKFEVSYD